MLLRQTIELLWGFS